MALNQTAFRSGVFGALPPAPAFRSGSLGALPPAPAFRSGSLGVLSGGPPWAPAFKSGSLGVLGGGPPWAPAFRSGSLGEYFAQNGLGDAAASPMPLTAVKPPIATFTLALAGLGAVGVIWWAMARRHA